MGYKWENAENRQRKMKKISQMKGGNQDLNPIGEMPGLGCG